MTGNPFVNPDNATAREIGAIRVKDVTFIRSGFYPVHVHRIQETLARYAERVPGRGADELASKINAIPIESQGFTNYRLSVTEWELISDAFLECGNDIQDANVAAEVSEMLRNHGWAY